MLEKALNQSYPVSISKLDYSKCLSAFEKEIYEARYDFVDGYYSHQFEYIFPEDENYCFVSDWSVSDGILEICCCELYYEGQYVNLPLLLDLGIDRFEKTMKEEVINLIK